MCCAACGFPRGSNKEQVFLASFGKVRMTAIAIPRQGKNKELPVRRLQDYHTVQNTKTADGKTKDCHITHRQYLADASFGILLEGEFPLLKEIADAFGNPVWGIWLGRKTCIPAAPVFAGLKNNREDALRLLIRETSLSSFTRQEEVENFAEGLDSLPDTPVSFATDHRSFSPRRIRTIPAVKPL